MSVSTALFGLIWRVLETYKIDPSRIIAESLYRPGNPVSARAHVSADEYYSVVGAALQFVDDEAVGIRAASLMHPSHLDVLGHAWIAGPTLLSGLRMMQDFSHIIDRDLQFDVALEQRRVGVVYDSCDMSPFPRVTADTRLGGLIRFCRLQYGESFTPLSVSLRRPVPDNRWIWDEYFGVPVQFGARCNKVYVDRARAEQPLSTAHPKLFDLHSAALAQIMVEVEQSDIVAQVRTAIRQLLPTGELTEERIAAIVGLKVRTLHRRLRREGFTFRKLLRDVRIELARRYIQDERHNITEIAFLLGYSDASAFTRAFRGWFGDAPKTYRARNSPNRRSLLA